MKFSELVRKIIALAEAKRDYWNAELPKRHPNYPLINPGDEDNDGPPPPEEVELVALLEGLTEEELRKLVLVMGVGVGFWDTHDLTEKYESVSSEFGGPEEMASMLGEKSALASDLEDGLAELAAGGVDVDDLNFAPVAPGR